MKKFIIFIITTILTIFTCACNKEQSQILFNKVPFSSETIVSGTNVFSPTDRIYYLVTLPEPVVSKKLLIQVMKIGGGTDERLGYDLVWGKQVKLRDEEIHYFTDYIVINETGAYIMKVYSKDDPTKILTSSQFYVKN